MNADVTGSHYAKYGFWYTNRIVCYLLRYCRGK